MPQLDIPALKRRVVDANEEWARAMRAICADAARHSAPFDEAGFDRAVAAYAADLASPAGDFISRLDEAQEVETEADTLAETLAGETALYGAAAEAAHHSTHFTRSGLRAA